jgi:hypothetical protein
VTCSTAGCPSGMICVNVKGVFAGGVCLPIATFASAETLQRRTKRKV